MKKKIRVEVRRDNGRLRAYLFIGNGKRRSLIARWWLEGGGRRYNPLKPVPARAWLVLNQLNENQLKNLTVFLLMADDWEYIEFNL